MKKVMVPVRRSVLTKLGHGFGILLTADTQYSPENLRRQLILICKILLKCGKGYVVIKSAWDENLPGFFFNGEFVAYLIRPEIFLKKTEELIDYIETSPAEWEMDINKYKNKPDPNMRGILKDIAVTTQSYIEVFDQIPENLKEQIVRSIIVKK